MQIYEIPKSSDRQSLASYGSLAFPFEHYVDEISRYKNACIDWHWHNELEFVYVTEQTVLCKTDARAILMPTHTGIFINSGTIHSFQTDSCGKMCSFVFSPRMIAEVSSELYKNYVEPILSSKYQCLELTPETTWQSDMLDILRRIVHEVQSDCSTRELNIQIQLLTLWKILFEQLEQRGLQKPSSSFSMMQHRMQRMLHFIQENYPENISVSDIAASANISKSETLRCFHACIQTTPGEYLIQYRLHKAVELLSDTNQSITSIAPSVGFSNISYFDRVFKRQFGITPLAMRNTRRNVPNPTAPF